MSCAHSTVLIIMPRCRGDLSDTAIRPSVCLSRGAAALGYRLSHRRPPEMCGLRTRPRTDVDPSRVELPSAGEYRLAAPRAITCLYKVVGLCCVNVLGPSRSYAHMLTASMYNNSANDRLCCIFIKLYLYQILPRFAKI